MSKKTNFFHSAIICLAISLFFTPAYGYERENPVVRAVRKVGPAVVNISSEYEVRKRSSPFSRFGDSLFDSFFRDFFEPGFEQRYKKSSLGSGVIIDGKRGLILTNAHVVEKTGTIMVVLKDEREFKAGVVGADSDSDLAVLQILSESDDPKSDIKSLLLPSVEMGNSDDLMIGETVIAIGNPFGFSHTVTTGVISALNRSVRAGEKRAYHNFIQTDASINPGNSGGPLLNINGDLIGINTAVYAKAQGIGFAIPINKARRIVFDLIRYGEVTEPWMGMVVQDLNPDVAHYLKIPGNGGAIVKGVEWGSPAYDAGIREGDIILYVGTLEIYSSQDYDAGIKNFAAGDTVKMTIWRSRKKRTVSVKTEMFPLERASELAYTLLGIRVDELSKMRRYNYDIRASNGVIITEMRQGTHLADIGVTTGDVIRQVGDMAIRNVNDFEKAMVKNRKKPSVVILLQRGDQGYYITVKLR